VLVRVCGVVLAVGLFGSGCSVLHAGQGRPAVPVTPTTTTTAPPTTTTTTTTPAPPPDFGPAVAAAVAAVPDGHVAVAVYDRVSGGLVAAHDPDTQYYTESVVKLLIGLDALDHGGDPAKVTEMIERSDDGTANALWETYGGNAIVSTMVEKIGLTETAPPHDPRFWGDTRTTANDLVKIYQYVLNTAPAAERDTVVAALHGSTQLGKDGNDQWFGIPDAVGPATSWGVKQGWGCCEPSWVLNTTGLVGKDDRYIVILLVSFTSGNGNQVTIPATHAAEITAAAKALTPDLAQ
jgi:hypothetical protein